MKTRYGSDGSQAPVSGRLWDRGDGEAPLRVFEFAGLAVPEDGLAVSPPSGGTLTVWPDGRYEFAPPALEGGRSGDEPVSTFYGYAGEDLAGDVVAGSFELAGADEGQGQMQDFQSWSLPGLLDGAADVLLDGADAEVLEFFAGGAPDGPAPEASAALADVGLGLDDLTRLILESHQS